MPEVLTFFILFPIIFSIPYICRYLGKAYPCNWASLIATISFDKNRAKKTQKKVSKKHIEKRNLLKKNLFLYSFFIALILSILSTIISSNILLQITQNNILILCIFNVLYTLFILMAEIDKRYYIIPDIFSYPFILFSMLFVSILTDLPTASIQSVALPSNNLFAHSTIDASMGGLYGYAIGALISSIMYKKYGDAFGNGDIKLLAAVGVLAGFDKLYQIVLLSVIVFFAASKILKEKYLPYATVLFVSFLIYLLYGIFA